MSEAEAKECKIVRWTEGSWVNIGRFVRAEAESALYNFYFPEGKATHVIRINADMAADWNRWTKRKDETDFGVIYLNGRLYRGHMTDYKKEIGWINPGMGYFCARVRSAGYLELTCFVEAEFWSRRSYTRFQKVPYQRQPPISAAKRMRDSDQ